MSYQKIIGHETAKAILGRPGSLGHAYLFSGEEGIGKFLMAKTLAKAVNCASQSGDSCEVCSSCAWIEKGIHPDVSIITPSSTNIIKIEQVRVLREHISLKPHSGFKKVFIIDEAHAMNASAQNALLKTLEEPPDCSLLVLVSHAPQALLPTIRSRCQTLHFTPAGRDVVERYIRKMSLTAPHGVESLARLSEGRIGFLTGLLADTNSCFEMRRIAVEILLDRQAWKTDKLQAAVQKIIDTAMASAAVADISKPDDGKTKRKESAGRLRKGMKTFLRIFGLVCDDLVRIKLGFELSGTGMENFDALCSIKDLYSLETLLLAIEKIRRAHLAVDRNCDISAIIMHFLYELLKKGKTAHDKVTAD